MNIRNIALFGIVILMLGWVGKDDAAPEHVFLNGHIYTVDSDRSIAEAVATQGGKIIFVGTTDQARELVGDKTRVHDLQGKMMLPGLHDVHIHSLIIVAPDQCNLASTPMPLEELVRFVKACMSKYRPTAGEWMIVDQWNFTSGNQPSMEYPTVRAALDAVSKDTPIFLRGNDGRRAAVNSVALALAVNEAGEVVGIDANTVRIDFARHAQYIGTEDSGEPNGHLSEAARYLVNPPDVHGMDSMTADRMPEVAALLASRRITSIQDAELAPRHLALFDDLANSGGMTFRLTAALFPEIQSIDSMLNVLLDVRAKYSTHDTIKATAAKIYVDGGIEGNPLGDPPTQGNAAVLHDYKQPRFTVDTELEKVETLGYVNTRSALCHRVRRAMDRYSNPALAQRYKETHGFWPSQCARNRGVLEHDETFINDYMQALHDNDFVIHAHVIGDRAVRTAVTSLARFDKVSMHGLPHTLAHAQLIHPSDKQKIGELGLYLAFTYA